MCRWLLVPIAALGVSGVGCSEDDSLDEHHQKTNNGAACGNGTLDEGEICDGPSLAGKSCASLGYDGGDLGCSSDCAAFDTSGCNGTGPACGNGTREGTEMCDGPDLGDQSCESLGHAEGALACLPDCSGFDTSDCSDVPDPGPAGTCGTDGATGSWEQIPLDPQRYYFVRAPEASAPLPLIMVFHGDGTSASSNEPVEIVVSYWAPVQAADMRFILVGMKCPGCASWYQNLGPSEQYIWDVLADVSSRYNVDVSRIYASGYSGGSQMLARIGLKFQSVLAGIHFNCGGGYYGQAYEPPPRSDCKVDARFVVSASDFLYDVARSMESFLRNRDHHVDFVVPSCSGHCCYVGPGEAGQTWSWFQDRTKCKGIVGGSCADITTLP